MCREKLEKTLYHKAVGNAMCRAASSETELRKERGDLCAEERTAPKMYFRVNSERFSLVGEWGWRKDSRACFVPAFLLNRDVALKVRH